jgi:transmembrane sensor
MNRYSVKDGSMPRRLVEAVAWRTHLSESNAETSEAFETWLAADERNAAAWTEVQRPWEFFGEHAAAPELIEIRRAALADARNTSRNRWIRPTLLALRSRFAVAASILMAAAAGILIWQSMQADIYRTASGERRVVTLADGSQIALDSQSEVRVRYGKNARNLVLSRGQARFDVAHDVERPFSVVAGNQKVVATGTSFNIDMLGSNLLITLIEGRVVVLPQTAVPTEFPAAVIADSGTPHGKNSSYRPAGHKIPSAGDGSPEKDAKDGGVQSRAAMWSERQYAVGPGIELVAGEQLLVSPTTPPTIEQVNVERATAWQNGQLVFEDEPLSSVVARVNRYAHRPIDLADVQTSELRISGVFRAGDIDGFVSTITHYLPVRAGQGENGSIRLSRR